MLSLRERLTVVNLYEELGSYRAVAALVGCDHKTVKAWLERERDGRSVKSRPRATDPFLPLIRSEGCRDAGQDQEQAPPAGAARGRVYGQLAHPPARVTGCALGVVA
jgi:hypothetical protein